MRHPSRRALGLIEVLVGLGVLLAVMVPLLGLSTSGRRSAEFNARRYQALQLAERTLEAVRQRAAFLFDSVVSEEEPRPVVGDEGTRSRYFRSYVGDREVRSPSFAELEAQLDRNFSVTVHALPLDGVADALRVRATILFRLSPAHPTRHRLELETVVARRSPF